MSEFYNVAVQAKANIYFEGRVISHTIILADGSKKTLGVILEGEYYFETTLPERMEIIEGEAKVTLVAADNTDSYLVGDAFDVPANSGFTISVKDSPCHYVCSFLTE